jgi:hypothetical protein
MGRMELTQLLLSLEVVESSMLSQGTRQYLHLQPMRNQELFKLLKETYSLTTHGAQNKIE